MRPARLMLWGLLWTGSLVVAALLGGYLGVGGKTPRSTENAPSARAQADGAHAATLEAEVDKLLGTIAELEEARERLLRDYLTLGLKHALEDTSQGSGAASPDRAAVSRREVETVWNDRLAAAENASGFDDGIAAYVALVANMAMLGETGIRYFAERILEVDEEEEPDSGEMMEMLAYIPHPASLYEIIGFRDAPAIDPDDRLEALRTQMKVLSPEQAAPYVPRLRSELSAAFGTPDEDGDRTALLAMLAFDQQDARSFSLLRDARLRYHNVSAALKIAGQRHSNDARVFVEDVARFHEDPGQREQAATLLEGW